MERGRDERGESREEEMKNVRTWLRERGKDGWTEEKGKGGRKRKQGREEKRDCWRKRGGT